MTTTTHPTVTFRCPPGFYRQTRMVPPCGK
jgi:hypothetical protein